MAATARSGDPPPRYRLALAAAGLSIALMLPGIAEPYGGFLAYSEAWYTLIARNFARTALWSPEVAPGVPDFNVPPLFAWLLHAGFWIGGGHEWIARLVAIAGAAAGVFALARAGGTAAGFLLASTPAWVLVGRNVQPDGWAISLSVAAWAAWRAGGRAAAAVLFGAAIMTKPTVLLLPLALLVAALLQQRGWAWLGRRHLIWAAASALPTLGWTLFQLLAHRQQFLAGIRHGQGAFEWPTWELLPVLVRELFYAGFPALFPLAFYALGGLARDRARLIPATVLALGIASFTVMHYHGYYLVAYLPAAAMLAGAALAGRRKLTIVMVAINALSSLVLLGGHKLGRGEIAALARAASGATFVLSPEAHQASWTLFALYGDPRAILSRGCATGGPGELVVRVPPVAGSPADLVGSRSPHAFAVAGWALVELPVNAHRLAWGPLAVVRAPGRWLGFEPLAPEIAAAATRVPEGLSACP